MTERFKPSKPLPEDSIGVKSELEKMVEETKKTPKDEMKRVSKLEGGMMEDPMSYKTGGAIEVGKGKDYIKDLL